MLTFYKVNLQLSNGQTLPITVAAHGIERVGPLVESKKVLYNRKDYQVTGFFVESTKYPLGMDEKTYDEEVSYCDIVDEIE